MTTQKLEKIGASTRGLVSKSKPKNRKLPPELHGYLKRGAARAKAVLSMYEKLNPGLEGFLVSNIVRDMFCLSACEGMSRNVDTECIFAITSHQDIVAEFLWEAEWYDDMESAMKAAEAMMYPDLK